MKNIRAARPESGPRLASLRGHGYVNLNTNTGFRAFYTGANHNNGGNTNNGAFHLNGNNDSSNENDNYAARLSSKAPSAKQTNGARRPSRAEKSPRGRTLVGPNGLETVPRGK